MAAAEQRSCDHILTDFSSTQIALTQDPWSKAADCDVQDNTNQSEFEFPLFWQGFLIQAIKNSSKFDSPAALFLIEQVHTLAAVFFFIETLTKHYTVYLP